MPKQLAEMTRRIEKALEIASDTGYVGVDYHKMWIIDQMVRALTGCQMVKAHAVDSRGNPYVYDAFDESEEYLAFVKAYNDGEDGPDTYEWDTGIAP